MVVGKLRYSLGFLVVGLVAVAGLSAFQGRTAPPTTLVVSIQARRRPVKATTQIPPGWQLKVNSGQPDISFTNQSDGAAAFHFRSVRSSFALERSVDIDPAQLHT